MGEDRTDATALVADGANAHAHDEEERRPAKKRMERFIVPDCLVVL